MKTKRYMKVARARKRQVEWAAYCAMTAQGTCFFCGKSLLLQCDGLLYDANEPSITIWDYLTTHHIHKKSKNIKDGQFFAHRTCHKVYTAKEKGLGKKK